jgi:methionyl-tRNA synthetase
MSDDVKKEPEVCPVVPAEPAAPAPAEPAHISIDDFAKVEMRVGTILSAEPIEGSEKLLKLSVDFGEATPRQVLSGIAKFVAPADLVGKQCPFVTNLKPRPMMGLESHGMLLAGKTADGGVGLLHPASALTPGTKLG